MKVAVAWAVFAWFAFAGLLAYLGHYEDILATCFMAIVTGPLVYRIYKETR